LWQIGPSVTGQSSISPIRIKTMQDPVPFVQTTVRFKSAGVECAGLLYLPRHAAPEHQVPAVALASGIGSLKEMGLLPYAEGFAARGIAALLFDYRYLGESGGEPREQVVPADQLEDFRNALTYLALRPEVSEERLGLWGTSFSGGHVLHLAASDARVKAVVSQVPAVDMVAVAQMHANAETLAARGQAAARERKRLYSTGELRYLALASPDGVGALMGAETNAWQEAMAREFAPHFVNRITRDSIERISECAPGLSIHRIAPKPLLMMLGTQDQVVPPELIRSAFARAGEPKKLIEFEGGHYAGYSGEVQQHMVAASANWFLAHL
jgi:fermentation-respiration switch protein FrsA (DUF1100 family)